MSSLKTKLWMVFLLILPACGGGSDDFLNTDSPQPVLIAAVPPSAKPGALVQIQGVGFSPVVNQNAIFVGGASATATSYGLIADPAAANGASDQIEFTLPDSATPGASTLMVIVGETPSNTIAFTVESP